MNATTKAHILLPIVCAAALSLAAPASALLLVDEHGRVLQPAGQVLGQGSGSSGSGSDSDEDSSGSSDEDRSGNSDESDEANVSESDDNSGQTEDEETQTDSSGRGSDEEETETRSADGTRTKVEIRDDSEIRTEVRFSDNTKVKTRTEDDRTRTDVYQGGVKIRLERVGGRFRLKAETEDGEQTELGEDEIVAIDERADRNQIRIRTFSAPAEARHRAIVERLNTQALTDLPLSVDLTTNELTVTTPAGERTVTVLPDQAVQNMLAANVIDRLGGEQLAALIRQGGIQTLGQVITLAQQDGAPVYEIQGVKEHRLLGFLPATTAVTVTVSAETGEIVKETQPFLDRLIDILSIDI